MVQAVDRTVCVLMSERVRFTDRPRRLPHPARDDGTKYCPECERILPLSEFRADPTVAAGVVPYCNPCQRKLVNAWRNRKKLLLVPEGMRRCRTCREIKPESEFEHPEYRVTVCRLCKQATRDREAALQSDRHKRYYQVHRRKYLAQQRTWRAENQEEVKARDRQYRQGHRWTLMDRSRVKYIRRQHPNYAGKIVPYRCLDIFCRDDWNCQLCGGPVDPLARGKSRGGAAIYHLIPLKQDGDDSPDNVVLAHSGCIARKGSAS